MIGHHRGVTSWGGGATQDILHRVTAPSRGRKYIRLKSESSAISGYCVNLRGGKPLRVSRQRSSTGVNVVKL